MVVVSAKLPVNNINELIDYVRKNPNVPYGSVGNGSAQHLAGAYFEQLVGARMTHVHYKGGSPAFTDLIAGQTSVMFTSPNPTLAAVAEAYPAPEGWKLTGLVPFSSARNCSSFSAPSRVDTGNSTSWSSVSRR